MVSVPGTAGENRRPLRLSTQGPLRPGFCAGRDAFFILRASLNPSATRMSLQFLDEWAQPLTPPPDAGSSESNVVRCVATRALESRNAESSCKGRNSLDGLYQGRRHRGAEVAMSVPLAKD